MSLPKADSFENALGSILSDHFDNSQNPHETIYRIWFLLNVSSLCNASPESTLVADHSDSSNVADPTYN